MKGMSHATLSDVCRLVTDGTHDTPKRVDQGYPLIKAKEIVGGQIDFATCDQISEADHLKVISRSKPERGDTLFAHIGASLGEAAYVGCTREFSIKNIALFKPNTSIIDGRYLYYAIIGPAFQGFAKGSRTGSAQPFLSLGQLRGHPISFHKEIGLQRRIASILSAYDDLIENNMRRIAILEEMARRIYDEWFVRFRFPGHENVRMVESEVGLVPEGWDLTTLGAVCAYINRGLGPKYDDDAPGIVINQKCIRDQRLNLSTARRQSKAIPREKQVALGDVLINSTGVGTLGRVAQVMEPLETCTVDTHVSIVRPTGAVNHDYFGLALLSKQSHFEAQGVGSTGQTELSRGRIAETSILLPGKPLQEQFGKLVCPMRQLAVKLQAKNGILRTTRDLLLPKLISGELDVSALPEPETVSA